MSVKISQGFAQKGKPILTKSVFKFLITKIAEDGVFILLNRHNFGILKTVKLTKAQQQRVEAVAKQYHLKLVLLFGSRSENRIHKESDFDIAYLTEKPLDFESEYHLNYEFTNVFQTDRIDTVDLRKAPPLLLYAIFHSPQVLFQENDLIFPSYQVYAFKKYIEARPLYEEKFRRLRERFNQ